MLTEMARNKRIMVGFSKLDCFFWEAFLISEDRIGKTPPVSGETGGVEAGLTWLEPDKLEPERRRSGSRKPRRRLRRRR